MKFTFSIIKNSALLCVAVLLPLAASAQCPDATIRIEVLTDDFPDETSWELFDRGTLLVFATGTTQGQSANTGYFWEVCVNSADCFDFTIFDSFGDGICCSFGNGAFAVYYNGVLVGSGGTFATSASIRAIGSCGSFNSITTDNDTYTPEQLINDVLLGSCVSAFNVTYSGSLEAIGYFSNGQDIGMSSGVLLTTGSTDIAVGPNNIDDATVSAGTGGDTDLETAAGLPLFSTSDAAVIEFDFVSFQSTVTFNYIFASEEYAEYVCSEYNDAFAFLVTGPGYAPNTNIALIPGTTTPVAINSVNNGTVGAFGDPFNCTSLSNTAYYVDNSLGWATEYDAFTVPLTATMNVVPCQTYHIKLVVADAFDDLYDSGVFLQAQSFSGGQEVGVVATTTSGSDVSHEGCFDATFTFFREDTSNIDRISLPFTISGTAIEGVDYQIFPDSIIIPAGQQSFAISVVANLDGIAEGQETVIISYTDGCTCGTSKSDTLYIVDNTPLLASISGPTAICDGQSITLTASGSGSQSPYGFSWDAGGNSSSILVNPASTTTYTVTVTDACNSQTAIASHLVSVQANFFTQVSVSICNGDSLFVGGDFQTQPGVYNDTFITAAGCDSIVKTTLSVIPFFTTTVNAAICDGDAYFAGGTFQTESGTYFDTLQSANGCDSIVTTNLTVFPNFSETRNVSICDGESYFVGGGNQTTSGTYYDSLLASTGCDSVIITVLDVLPNAETNINASICDDESYFAGGEFQTQSGTYYDTLAAANGCDSIIITNLTVNPNYSETRNVSICDGESFFAGGSDQTASGTYYDSLLTVNGCDSIIITNLTILLNSFTVQVAAICEGESYFAGGDFQTESGIYYDTLVASNGCDSIVTTNLTVSPEFLLNQDVSICDGDSFFTGGAYQTVSGTYSDTFATASGCDSIIVTTLTVTNVATGFASVSICDGESFFAGGDFQTQAGTYYDTLTGTGNCDSIIVTELTVLPHASTTVNASICDGDGYFAGGNFQTESGMYFDTLVAANGCDSVITTNLTVHPNYSVTEEVSICDGESYFAGGGNQTTSGTYYDSLLASTGCDSVLITNLTVLPNPQTTINTSICDGESYFAGGNFQTQSGIYFDTLPAANGCDSVVTTNLTVLLNSFATVDPFICFGESYFAGGDFQTEKGTYFDTLVAANGCDSIITTNLEVLPIPFTSLDVSICEGESYFVGGGDQTEAGIYFDTLVASNGCDSIVATNLTLLPPSFSLVNAAICEGESYFAGGDFQTVPGNYFDTLTGANGCDSIVTTTLIVHPVAVTIIDTTICDGSGYSAGGAIQTVSGIYYDTLATSLGCDSIVITNLTVSTSMSLSFAVTNVPCNGLCDGALDCTVSGGQDPLAFSWDNGGNTALINNLCAGTYGVTVTDANGCTAESSAAVGEPEVLTAIITHSNISCNCANSVSTQNFCLIDFAGLPAGTVLNEQLAQHGIHMAGDAQNSATLDQLIVFNSNATGTQDPDLQVNIGNLAILPQNMVDQNGDGLIDAPDDYRFGGKQIYTFDTPRDIISFVFVDLEESGTATAFDASGNVITSIAMTPAGNGSVQTITLNAVGASRLEIEYRNASGGVTQIQLDCASQCCDGEATCLPSGGTIPYSFEWSNGSAQQTITNLCPGNYDVTVTDDNGCQFSTAVEILDFTRMEVAVTHQDASANCAPSQLCELDFAGLPAGTLLNEQYAQFGIHISGDAYGAFPDQIIIFDADATGTPDPDLETASGNLAIFPENLTDANNDGLVDVPNDQGQGGRITFAFDEEREIISFVFVDRDNNNSATAKAYDANNNLIKTVNIPNRGNGSVQTVTVNASGVRRLVIDHRGSGGVTAIALGCNTICCDGSASATVAGGSAPYSYQWSNGSASATADSLCPGEYTVTVTDAEGCAATQTFAIADCRLNITGMMLVNEGFSADLAPLNDRDVISLDTLCPFNIRAVLCQSPVGSVKFKINGSTFRIEQDEPYALAGDNPTGDYHAWFPEPGEYTLEATPYSRNNAQGAAGNTFMVRFTVVGQSCGTLRTSIETYDQTTFEVSAYPIPFDEIIMVDLNATMTSTGTLRVTDIVGRELMRQTIESTNGKQTITLPTGNWLPNAIYFLEVRLNDDIRVLKLLKGK